MLYIIYSTRGGWVKLGGILSSDWHDAVAYDLETAKQMCRQRFDVDGQPEWVPVPLDLMRELFNG